MGFWKQKNVWAIFFVDIFCVCVSLGLLATFS